MRVLRENRREWPPDLSPRPLMRGQRTIANIVALAYTRQFGGDQVPHDGVLTESHYSPRQLRQQASLTALEIN